VGQAPSRQRTEEENRGVKKKEIIADGENFNNKKKEDLFFSLLFSSGQRKINARTSSSLVAKRGRGKKIQVAVRNRNSTEG